MNIPQSSSSQDGDAPAQRVGKRFLAAIALGTILAPINATAIAVVLSDIADTFSVTLGDAGWIITAYLIAMAVTQPVAGKLGDLLGRRELFLGAVAGLAGASIGAALSPNLPALLVWRVVMALTGAVAIPNGVALLRSHVPEQRRGAAFGLVGASAGLAIFVGPLLGAAAAHFGGWRAVFWINLPLAAAAFYLALQTFPRTPRRSVASFDVRGAALLAAFLTCFALMARYTGSSSVTVPLTFGAVALLLLWLFVANERRARQPLVDLRLLRVRSYASSLVIVSLSNAALFAIYLAVPLFVKEIKGLDVSDVSIVLAAFAAPVVFIPPIAGRLADRWGRRKPAVLGAALVVAGVAPLIFIAQGWSPGAMAALLFLVGAGSAFQMPAVQASSVDSVPSGDAGMASGVFSMCRYAGTILGTTIGFAILGSGDTAAGLVTIERLGTVFIFITALAAGSALACLGLRGIGMPSPPATTAATALEPGPLPGTVIGGPR